MNAPSIPRSENSICLPTYAEANASRDPEAQQQQQQYRSCRKSIWQKSKLFSIYAIGVLTILVLCGVLAYEMYIQYRVRIHHLHWATEMLTSISALDTSHGTSPESHHQLRHLKVPPNLFNQSMISINTIVIQSWTVRACELQQLFILVLYLLGYRFIAQTIPKPILLI
jgi:hypothetical protein